MRRPLIQVVVIASPMLGSLSGGTAGMVWLALIGVLCVVARANGAGGLSDDAPRQEDIPGEAR